MGHYILINIALAPLFILITRTKNFNYHYIQNAVVYPFTILVVGEAASIKSHQRNRGRCKEAPLIFILFYYYYIMDTCLVLIDLFGLLV